MVHARNGPHPGHHAARYPLPLNTPMTATFPPESCYSSPSPSQLSKLLPLHDSPEPSPTDHCFYTSHTDGSPRPRQPRQADPGHSRRRPIPSPLHRSFSPRQLSFSPFASGQNFYTHDEEDDDDDADDDDDDYNDDNNNAASHNDDHHHHRHGQQLSRIPCTADSFADLANPDSPRSPHDVLDGLLAAGREHFPRDDSPNIEAHQIIPTGPRRQSSLPDKSTAPYYSSKPYSYAQLRFLPGALHASRLSPPATPITMMPAAKPANLPDFRSTMPRNTSIDSAVSSISSIASQPNPKAAVTSTSHRAPQEAAAAQQPDFAALIQAAGSAEMALYNMWKEKHSLENHNQQLWRIVTKQKDMVVGLNKDLERALKERERYRKKLKENLSQATVLPSTASKIDALNRETSSSPALSEPQDTAPSSRKSSGNDVVPSSVRPFDRKASEESTPTVHQCQGGRLQSISSQWPFDLNAGSAPIKSNNGPANIGPSPLNDQAREDVSAPGGLVGTPASTSPQSPPKLRHLQLRDEAAGSRRQVDEAVSPKTTVSDTSLQTHDKAPALSLTSATPSVSSTEFSSPTEDRPHRKAPPAPLNLSQTQRSRNLHDAGDESDSDYEEVLNLDAEEMGVFSRGRKKTREDDDLQREYLVKKEADARSRSSKSKSNSQSKGTDGIPSPNALTPGGRGLPSSPRLAQAPGSINALLSPAHSDGSASRRVVSPPLMSPGLPVSPRPGDRPPGAPLPRQPKSDYFSSPQLSPRGASGLPLSPRPPRDVLPAVLPPQSFASPYPSRVEQPSSQQRHQEQASNANEYDRQTPPSSSTSNSESDKRRSSGSESEHLAAPDGISRELVSDQYPGLLLPPNALPLIQVKVFSSRLRPSRLSVMVAGLLDEDPVFLLSIHSRSSGKRLWRVEKTPSSLPVFDSQIKKLCEFTGQLPDRSLFSGHAPSKMDARRAALNGYFDKLLDTPMGERAALVICEYFSNDAFGADEGTPKPSALSSPRHLSQSPEKVTKEGYLTKKGKNFGGWKARYFVLESTDFRYYESPGGPLLGSIKIRYSQIGRQTPRNKANAQDEDMRHAFLILEPKKKDPSTKVSHILCAESDEERDSWIEALLRYVDPNPRPPEPLKPAAPPPSATDSEHSQTSESVQDAVQQDPEFEVSQARSKQSPTPLVDRRAVESPAPAVEKRETALAVQGASYEDMVAAESPTRGPGLGEMPSPQLNSVPHDHRMISAPTNGMKIENAELWGNKAMPAQTPVKDKKRSIFGFATYRARASPDLAPPVHHNTAMPHRETPPSVRPVWGIPLSEAVEYSQPAGADILLPAVVYRCLEYLKAKNAHREEGIFRLSGSNLVIRALRDRFNTEGDIKLLDGEYYDVHAVASLLKSYLRDLPTSILTRELHIEFLRVLDLNERQQKINTFNMLVHKLPPCNYDILRALSSFLIDIINNAHVNKMNIRNVGIVFSPTLNIPGPLISFFINDYDQIFGAPMEDTRPVTRETAIPNHNVPDAVRSPRLRTFSDTAAVTPSQNFFPPLQKQTPQGQGLGRLTMSHTYDPQAPRNDGPLSADAASDSVPFSLRKGAMNSGGSARDVKARRRESSMLVMGLSAAPKKNSKQRLQEDTPVVAEESAYE